LSVDRDIVEQGFVYTAIVGQGRKSVQTELEVDALRLAVAVVRYGHGPRRLARQLRQQGSQAARYLYEQLSADQRSDIDSEAQTLRASGVEAMLLGLEGYPAILASLQQAPPVLFYQGNEGLLGQRSVGICGSRNASKQGLSAAHACGGEIARCGLVVVSGYARGVDTEAHAAALDMGGSTVMVLAEGIARFKIKSRIAAKACDDLHATVVSQFPPSQAWSPGAAMNRNDVIIGLSLGLLVIEAGESGGTLAAGLRALDRRRPVLALEFRQDTPPGNKALLDKGAIPVRSQSQLRDRLRQILAGNYPGQPTLV
jgi:DNA processing protein